MMATQDGITTTFIPEGAVKRAGGYRPARGEMKTAKPATVKVTPALTSPRFGSITAMGKTYGFILDGSTLYVDSNRDGNYNEAGLTGEVRNKVMFWDGFVQDGANKAKISFYHFDESDASRAALKDTVLYYGDYGYEIKMNLGGMESTSVVQGELSADMTLWVDRNKDGKQSYNYELIHVGKAFNFTGTSYVVNYANGKLSLVKSKDEVAMAPMPPNFSTGADVLNFNAKTTAGNEISFPSSYKGKIVLLDFWATWCGPCMGEMPNVVATYEKYHAQGFEILGISFDQPNAEQKLKDTCDKMKMPWEQVYEGKFWNTTIGTQFDVSSIPFSVLVDGSTGKILGTGLRGEALGKAVGAALAAR